MPIFSPILPLDDALKMQIIPHFQAFIEVSDWKIQGLDGTGWVRIASESEARALCAKISEAGLAVTVQCNQEKGKANWIVIFKSIDIRALFRQSSAVVRAAHLKTDDIAMLCESLSSVDAHLAALPAAADVDDLELACSKDAELKKGTYLIKHVTTLGSFFGHFQRYVLKKGVGTSGTEAVVTTVFPRY